jgi:hypothetical protein
MAIDDTYTKALLHMDGADASTTFTDESGKEWTPRGNAQIDTAQYKFGGASLFLDGNGSYIDSPDSDDWQLDGGSDSNEWTIDFWIRFNGDPGTNVRSLFSQFVNTSNLLAVFLYNNTIYFYVVSGGSAIIYFTVPWDPADATWYHLAFVKQGTTGYKIFVDGTQVGSTTADTSPLPNLAAVFMVGVHTYSDGTTYYHNGWIDELRISKGIARWTANFTPPTREYGGGGQVIIWSE